MEIQARRMSPWTAFFIGMWMTGIVTIASVSLVVLYSLRIADTKAGQVLRLAGDTVEGLPGLIETLPKAVVDALGDRRAPDYVTNLKVQVAFSPLERGAGSRPVLTITNNGSEVVSFLAINVAALNDRKVPVREWSEVVATPLALGDEWRGPLLPMSTRYITIDDWRGLSAEQVKDLIATYEISDVRVWQPSATKSAMASAKDAD